MEKVVDDKKCIMSTFSRMYAFSAVLPFPSLHVFLTVGLWSEFLCGVNVREFGIVG